MDESKVSAGSWRLRGVARAQLNTSTCFADPSGRIGVAMFSTAATTAVPVPATRVVRRPSPIPTRSRNQQPAMWKVHPDEHGQMSTLTGDPNPNELELTLPA